MKHLIVVRTRPLANHNCFLVSALQYLNCLLLLQSLQLQRFLALQPQSYLELPLH